MPVAPGVFPPRPGVYPPPPGSGPAPGAPAAPSLEQQPPQLYQFPGDPTYYIQDATGNYVPYEPLSPQPPQPPAPTPAHPLAPSASTSSAHHALPATHHVPEKPHVEPQPQQQQQQVPTVTATATDRSQFPNPFDANKPREIVQTYRNQNPEFITTRYTAVTCAPDDFVDHFSLRQTGSEIEMMIVITMYNEEPKLFIKTMQAVHDNIRQMLEDRQWGEDGWRKILVCIVSDGRTKIHEGVLVLLSMMGVFRDGLIRTKVGEQDVTAHLFESTVQTNFEGPPERGLVNNLTAKHKIVPMQMLFCLKEKNAKKINSHRWFFKAFAHSINPKVCVLIDVGTQPQPNSIFRLWAMFNDNMVGGACGEIAVEGDFWFKLKPIIAAQNFEYKMSNILDKPIESLCGYISVLPGAFSAYRYEALQGKPLEEYFKGEVIEKEGTIFQRNMYLAEDRILCYELVTKPGRSWLLRYDKESCAVTDAPDAFTELIPQRRRWLNGSTFAFLYAAANMGKIFTRSTHTFFRKVILGVEFFYLILNFIFGFFSLSNFFFAFSTLVGGFVELMRQNVDPTVTKKISWLPTSKNAGYTALRSILLMARPVYVLAICITFIISLGNNVKAARSVFLTVIWLFAIIAALMLAMIVMSTIAQLQLVGFSFKKLDFGGDGQIVNTLLALLSTYGLYIFSSLLFGEWYHPIFNQLQYVLLTPFYVNVLQIFAYCNISETGWGTKGSNEVHIAAKPAAGAAAAPAPPARKELTEIPFTDESTFFQERHAQFEVLVHEMQKSDVIERPKLTEEDTFKVFRTFWLLGWIFLNGALLGALLSPDTLSIPDPANFRAKYLTGLFYVVLGFSAFRFLFSTLYRINNLMSSRAPGARKAGARGGGGASLHDTLGLD
ncbi:hypothetical protein, variant [Allomyces macrogynus ATCC 38327]|uniref:Chitin synthase n=1 Tax=Allomyces macrogynus (strain ATCC 38327) TaxID=578462 RepID=A0A0L0S456_ALLM3|nr:hypothetical protein, variant [Allomyces macrogynus ATCC 38327]|eukprot:KNE57215.1 hypothetical protein, variant [Allomyces macrogynus ATCC 38327]